MKEIKLEEGQVWQVPDKKWIRVRVIKWITIDNTELAYVSLGDTHITEVNPKSFRQWIRRDKARLIGIKNFKTGKVRAVKCLR